MAQYMIPQFRQFYSDYMLVPDVGVVKATPMDRAMGRSMKIEKDQVRRGLDKKQKEFSNLPVFRDLFADAFFSYYLNAPEFVDPDKLPAEYRISQLLLAWMSTQPESETAKLMTTGSAPASLAAGLYSWRSMLSDEAFEALRKALEQLNQMKNRIDQQKSKENQLEDARSSMPSTPPEVGQEEGQDSGQDEGQNEEPEQQQSGQSDGQEDEQETQERPQPRPAQQKKSEEMQQEYERKAQKVEEAVKRMMGNPVTNGAMRSVVDESLKKMEDLSAMAKAWGSEISDMSVVDIAAVMNLYDMNAKFIAQLSSLIGRSETASSHALQRVRESYIGNPTKINLTQDLSRVLPMEAILLSGMSPHILRTQQVINWADQGLLGWVVEAEGETQGSFVAYVDGSGSMGGDDILVAKAIAFGLAKVLHEDRYEQRAFTIKTFGVPEDGFKEITEKSALPEIAEWASHMFGGGTDFDYCFSDSLKELKKFEERDILGSDLVFITDGIASLSDRHADEWVEFSEQTGSRLLVVMIRERDTRRYTDRLEKIADLVLYAPTYEFTNNPEKIIEQIVDVVAMPRKENNGL
ncbi:MAG: hypothetical protein ACYTFW_00310 [Planctomycetota bacterium]|jgi:uncharacterized protein with von Willebrand factor type A (vWA) domain